MANIERKEQPKIQVYDPVSDINKKFDFYIKIVIGILLVAVLTMIFMVSGLLLDAFHFNSATYKEYSDKLEINKEYRQGLEELLRENEENQKMIIEQQKKITNSLEDI